VWGDLKNGELDVFWMEDGALKYDELDVLGAWSSMRLKMWTCFERRGWVNHSRETS